MDTMREVFTASSALESYSYERLEILGDAFLKLASSADLFHRYPNANEGDLSKMRSSVVSNQNLFNVAKRFDFGGLMPLEIQRKFSEKRLADFVEAFIGASFVNGGVESSINLLHTFGLVNETALTILGTKDLKSDWSLDESATFAPTITFSNDGFNLEKLESRIGYKFRNEKLASQAMTHQSYSLNLPSYEALEFLGDAVLDWIVMQYLFHTYSTLSPDKLTDLRQAAVNNESFCRLAVSIGLQEHLRHIHGSCRCDTEGPKVLGDLFEALVGAFMLIRVTACDSVASDEALLSGFWLRFVNPLVVSKSPVRQMHEHLQSIGFETDEVWYQFSEIDSVFCCKIFLLDTNIAEDTGNSRQLSKREHVFEL
ncbi:ribonuclease III [Rhizoclosmatium globosum]|uniref:Ribonuclease III n=1 Tax=Rhizoclosmatium globosum TaxID=329046 RepID=A0A1Y2D3X0_9FUNG|nr:ribonuclease III [Rhizoclosmatium globosum]|eukprot:ORY53275.1 ribonuclease III [Rhizoclosmatium globosum]